MKKSFILLFFILLSINLYAYEYSLSAVQKDDTKISLNRGVESQIITRDNLTISISVFREDSDLYFSVDITNNSENDYYFDDKKITISQGNVENNTWELLNYKTAQQYYDNVASDFKASEIWSAIGAGIMIANSAYSHVSGNIYSHGNSYVYTADYYSPLKQMLTASLVTHELSDLKNDHKGYLSFLRDNLLYPSTIPPHSTYSGCIIIYEWKGPDYKISFNLEDEFSFYFSRSDRAYIINPWLDRPYTRNTLTANVSTDLARYGITYSICRPKGVGFYVNTTYNAGNIFINPNSYNYAYSITDTSKISYINAGKLICGSYSFDPDLYDHLDYWDYEWKAENVNNVTYDGLDISAGLTIKTIPYLWLTVGCGINFKACSYYTADLYYKRNGNYLDTSISPYEFVDVKDVDYTFYDNVNYKQNDFKVLIAPEIGINFITNHLDLGAKFAYPIMGQWHVDLEAGFAF